MQIQIKNIKKCTLTIRRGKKATKLKEKEKKRLVNVIK